MKIEINLDETRFKDLVDDELGRFSNKELHDIIKKAIGQYVIDNDIIKEMFYHKKRTFYGSCTDEYELSPRIESLIKEMTEKDIDVVIKKTSESIKQVLEKDETIKRLTENLFYRFVTNRINEMLWSSPTLEGLITEKANNIVNSRLDSMQNK